MEDWYIATIMGIIEGLTEFLPISSTGHLILAGHIMDFSGAKADTFSVIIQLGAILAVVVLYRDRFAALLSLKNGRNFSGMSGLWLLFLTTLPALAIGYLAHDFIKSRLFNPASVAWALAVGALMIFAVEGKRKNPRYLSLDDITPKLALGIGLFQCLAMWPGFSRSAATIMGGMLLGAERKLAAEYSFIAAVPVMVAATGYDFYKNGALFSNNDLLFLALGFVVSFFAAWAAIKGFILLLGKFTLRPFAWYRLGLAGLVVLLWQG